MIRLVMAVVALVAAVVEIRTKKRRSDLHEKQSLLHPCNWLEQALLF
jgi:hypothetical protein